MKEVEVTSAEKKGTSGIRQSLDGSPDGQDRHKVIIRTSVIGIIANVFLAVFKAVIGILSHSIAITLDAVNNISDAASSVITIVGTKLAGKPADKKHPFGYGRIEYLSAMIISVIVLYAGITSFTESVKKIIHPETPDYSAVTLVIVAAGVIVKIILGRFVKSTGEKVNSDSLIASGSDATLDAIISASTLVAAVLYLTLHIRLEAWLGAVISVVIIKSGIEMLRDTLSEILGERADVQLARDIQKTIRTFPEVLGTYDLILNNYGPDTFTGSIHIEVTETMTAKDLDDLLRKIQLKVYQEHHIALTAIGIYSSNAGEGKAKEIRDQLAKIVFENPYILQMHGFYLDEEKKRIRCDLVISFDAKDRKAVYCELYESLQKAFPEYTLEVAMDTDFSLE